MNRLTIRARITGGSLIIAILISIVAGVVIYAQVQRIVLDGQQTVLDNIEAPYFTAIKETTHEEIDAPGAAELVAIVNPSGKAVANTLPADLSVQLPTLLAAPGTTKRVTAGGAGYLVRVTEVKASDGTWDVVSALATDTSTALLGQITFLLIASIAVINLAFGAASWLIGTAALAPVGQLRRSAAELVTSPGPDLLPEGAAHDEIFELARTLNQLIAQLRESAERERQIVSDASHEFRTPLAILTTQLELAQREATTLPALQADVAAAQATLSRLVSLATSMLELSRIDAQASPGRATLGELGAELADAADRGRQRASGRDIRIDYSSDEQPAHTKLRVSAADFGRLCDNLVSNALAAMPERGSIELSLVATADNSVVLAVADTGGGMAPEFVAHAFDRFARADQARTSGGAGLGLSIVAGVVALAGGTVVLQNRPGRGLTVVVTLPTA